MVQGLLPTWIPDNETRIPSRTCALEHCLWPPRPSCSRHQPLLCLCLSTSLWAAVPVFKRLTGERKGETDWKGAVSDARAGGPRWFLSLAHSVEDPTWTLFLGWCLVWARFLFWRRGGGVSLMSDLVVHIDVVPPPAACGPPHRTTYVVFYLSFSVRALTRHTSLRAERWG